MSTENFENTETPQVAHGAQGTVAADKLVATDEHVAQCVELVAELDALGTDERRIAAATGLDDAMLQTLRQSALYAQKRAKWEQQGLETQKESDVTWDDVEAEALRTLKANMAQARDPEFLLRVAGVANKAKRKLREEGEAARKGAGGIADDAPGAAGQNVVLITLPPAQTTFMKTINGTDLQHRQSAIIAQVGRSKATDFVSPDRIAEMLGVDDGMAAGVDVVMEHKLRTIGAERETDIGNGDGRKVAASGEEITEASIAKALGVVRDAT